MIPLLHEAVYDLTTITENYDWEKKSICSLPDATVCTVTETLNAEFQLTMTYPVGGTNWSELKIGRIIIAKASELADDVDPTQPFVINKISKAVAGSINVTASHISSLLSGVVVPPSATQFVSVTDLRDYLNAHAINNGFTFYASNQIPTVSPGISIEVPVSARELLFGSGENTVSKRFADSFEMRYNRLNVAIEKERGVEKDLVIRYASNLVSFTQTDDDTSIPKYIYGYIKYGDTYIDRNSTFETPWSSETSPRPLINVSVASTPNKLVKAVNLTDAMNKYFAWHSLPKTAEQVLTNEIYLSYAAYIWAQDNIPQATPPPSFSVSYVDLARTTDNTRNAPLSPVGCGDTITVIVPEFGINEARKVSAIKYNVLLDRNDSITVGQRLETFGTYLAGILREK